MAYDMTSILVVMVDESPVVPQDAVDIIIAQFLRADPRVAGSAASKNKKGAPVDDKQSTLMMKELPPAYNMGRTICNSCPEKMAREVSKYFNDVIVDASGMGEGRRSSLDMDELDTSAAGPDATDIVELEKAHRLLRELWRACPLILQNVIPQLEAELSAENVDLRLLATEALGDIASGIGAAGPPAAPTLDPVAYPPLDLNKSEPPPTANLLTSPSSPQPFPQAHPQAYSSFLSRRQDKSPLIRAAWVTGIGRILTTSAGGVGLNHDEETRLVEDMARMLNDSDEKVRLAAVRALGTFTFRDIINKLGGSGSVDTTGSVLANLSERVKDRKPNVRFEAMTLLGRIWGVAIGEIAAGNEQVIELVGGIPSKILNVYYTNDPEILVLMDQVLFEILLPITYPPIKSKSKRLQNGSSQRVKDSQAEDANDSQAPDPDKIRVERILLLAHGLDERAKKIFFSIGSRQVALSRYLQAYLQACEDYNGGVVNEDEASIKQKLTRMINELAKFLPDPTKVTADLWKFAKLHDRRSYQLMRFCMAPESDYRLVNNGIKEFTKRQESNTSSAALLDTLLPFLYRISILFYNQSHVPAIMDFSRTDALSLAAIAHEILTEISQKTPEVLKAQVREICLSLQGDAPTASKTNGPGAVDSLKACAAFARKFPDEIPQDRTFAQAMASFAVYGSPPEAAKHAVSIIMAASNKREMLAKDLVQKCVKDFEYGKAGFLSRLAALSRLCLLASHEVTKVADTVIDIATKEILLEVRDSAKKSSADEYTWSAAVDDECAAKCWAIKILVNYVRSQPADPNLAEIARPVYALLDKLIATEGELSKAQDTPATHKPRLRLVAARSYLKLCLLKSHDALLGPRAFNKLVEVAQDGESSVRSSFLHRLKKYLGQNNLPPRFYTIAFLLAYEPDTAFKAETATWIKSRAAFFASYKPPSSGADTKTSKPQATLEAVFARLISLLAHHPDYGDEPQDLIDLARYITFYLSTVATDKNASIIYHIAQRIKAMRDAISTPTSSTPKKVSAEAAPDYTSRLHTLSDLATHATHAYIDAHGWTLQSLPARVTLPRSLFSEIKDHMTAVSTAEKNFLPEGVQESLESLVRSSMRKGGHGTGTSKKRKSEAVLKDTSPKRPKTEKTPAKDKPKKAIKKIKRKWDGSEEEDVSDDERRTNGRAEPENRRKSGRVSLGAKAGLYTERDDSEDDAELEREDKEMPDAEEEEEEEEEANGETSEHEVEEEAAEEEEEQSEPEELPTSTRKSRATTKAKPTPKTPTKPKNKFKSSSSPSKGKSSSPAARRAKSTPKQPAAAKSSPATAPRSSRSTRGMALPERSAAEGRVTRSRA